jgi:hypothetical protein
MEDAMAETKLPVFRIVDGERVRVPGDIRDPSRRYGSTTNVQTGDSCLVEFTDEEEREADARKVAWEAERPQREAEEKRLEEEAARFRESLRYETRIVAFLDILGWAAATTASLSSIELTQHLGIAMQGIVAHVNMVSWQRDHAGPGGWPGDPMMTHFSDSVLVSFAADNHAKRDVEMALSTIIHSLSIRGFIVRGAVSYGQLIHRQALAYGPALVAAYQLEKDEAIVPRIILDRSLASAWGFGESIQKPDGTILGCRKLWREDEDGWYYFDHLSYWRPMLDSDGPSPVFETNMERWRKLIVQRLGDHRDHPHVFRKYIWLARYFNRTASRYQGGSIGTISLPGE